jgi:aminoglycoside phosphotransferase (APT) family kinase protein
MNGAVEAAVAAARAHGIETTQPRVLRDRLNVIVHLHPAPVVARIPGTITRVRKGDDHPRRELQLAGELARAGAPVVAPSAELPPGPHHRDGHAITFWTYVPPNGEPDPQAAGEALRHVHEALRGLTGALPPLNHLSEAEALLSQLAAEEVLEQEAALALHERIVETLALMGRLRTPVQPLHGDAHLGNVLNGPGGPLWTDFEDACIGPVHWDAACMLTRPRFKGEGHAEAAAALAAAGLDSESPELELWIQARMLQGEVWSAFIAHHHATGRRGGG